MHLFCEIQSDKQVSATYEGKCLKYFWSVNTSASCCCLLEKQILKICCFPLAGLMQIKMIIKIKLDKCYFFARPSTFDHVVVYVGCLFNV